MFDLEKYPNCARGHKYALEVVSGNIPSCLYIIGACKRYLKDIEEEIYPFDADAAERFLRLVQKFSHVKGNWTPPNIYYQDWQCFAFMNIMGFMDERTGFRRFRIAHVEVPRGQGKSLMASQAGLYFLALDNPQGNEIDCVATKKDQARIVLDSARAMATKNANFCKVNGVQVQMHKIVHPKSFSSMQALSSDHNSMDGRASVMSIADELHAMKRETFDVVYSGMSKRTDSLMLCITTAGMNMENVGYSQSVYAKKVATGEIEDDQFFSLVYTIDEDDDIYDEENWKKANPNYGVSVDPITFAAKAKRAKEVPADLPNFKVKHLNIWLSEAQAFFDTNELKKGADPTLTLDQFKGEKCKMALDVSSHIDLTSLGLIFKRDGIYYLFDKSFIPEETVSKVRSSMYDNCIGQGHLHATTGAAINQKHIVKEALEFTKMFRVSECFFDPWSAVGISQELMANRVNMVEFRMNTGNLSEPTKKLDALIREGKVRYNGSPLLEWCFGNVVCKIDANDNVYPRKEHERLKIDPVITLIMCLAGYIQDEMKDSVYETRGIITL